MTTRLRLPMLVLGTTILVMQAVFMPVSMVYAETNLVDTEKPQHQNETLNSESYLDTININESLSDDDATINSKENKKLASDYDTKQSSVEEERDFLEESTVPFDKSKDSPDENINEINFSFDVGEYLEVNSNEIFEINVNVNESIDTLRLTIPINNDFNFEDESGRSLIEEYEDGSNAWLISFNKKSNFFSMTISLSESGQISIEDAEAEVHAAFLYINTGVSTRNSQSLSESAARSTVSVSTWATFRTAWNNASRTVIDVTSNIPSGTTMLNSRNTNVTIQTSVGTSFVPVVLSTGSMSLLWTSSTVTLTRAVFLDAGSISGNNLIVDGIARIRLNGVSTLQNLVVDGAMAPFNQVDNLGNLTINQNLDLNRTSAISTYTTIIVRGQVNLNGQYLIRSEVLGVLPIQASRIIQAHDTYGLAVWEGTRFSFSTPASRYWQRLSFTLTNGLVTQSSQPTFNSSSFQLNNNVSAISSTGFSSSGGAIVLPPVPEESRRYSLSFSASPSEGGNPNSTSFLLAQGETTTIRANSSNGYKFIRWEILSGSNGRIENPLSENTIFTMGNSQTIIRAVYEQIAYEVNLIASPSEGGSPNAELISIKSGETTKISANPNEGYEFIRWEIISGAESSLENSLSENTILTMGNSNTTLQAVYKETHTINPVNPVDPLEPEIEIDPENKPNLPENQGQLSIDFVSSFNFGSQAISAHNEIYYAKPQRLLNEDGTVNESEERPNYVQISDRRSENDRNGWTLAVTQKEQFKGEENQVLNGASLSFSNQQVISAQGGTAPGLQSVPCTLVPGNRRTLLQAQGSEGTGTWIYRFGDGGTAAESVALDVPRGANPEATTYSSTLIWELSAVPSN